MYTEYFGLNTLPFENVPDPEFYFDQGDYHRIFKEMVGFLKAGRGLMVIAGPIGAGKTTLSNKLMAEMSHSKKIIWLSEPPKNSTDLLLFVAQELGIKVVSQSRVFILRDIREHLLKNRKSEKTCLMIIDEAHLLSDNVMAGIRLLNNLEEGAEKLIQIMLVGQEELIGALSRPELEPFKQRIANTEILGRLSTQGVHDYILHRLHVAGAANTIFTNTGIGATAACTGGTPRLINSVCDKSLIVAFKKGKKTVDMKDVDDAAQGLGLGRETFRYMTLSNMEKKSSQLNHAVKNEQHAPSHTEIYTARQIKKEPQKTFVRSHSTYKKSNQKKTGMGFPLLLLFFSVVALTFSVAFYCDKRGSSDVFFCLEELFTSLFI